MTDVATRSLDSLAQTINDEHAMCERAASDVMTHAIACGAALLEARARVAFGEWTKWCNDNLAVGAHMAAAYMRVAEHGDLVSDARSVSDARRILRSLNATPMSNQRRPAAVSHATQRSRDEAKRLRDNGMKLRDIAAELGVAVSTVQFYLDPEKHRRGMRRRMERQRQETAARQALERERRAAAVKAVGGNTAAAYALIRRAAQHLDGSIADAEDVTTQRELRAALGNLYRAEDGIVRALRIERTVLR